MSFALAALLAVQAPPFAYRFAGDEGAASALVAFGLPGGALRASSRAAVPLGLRRPGAHRRAGRQRKRGAGRRRRLQAPVPSAVPAPADAPDRRLRRERRALARRRQHGRRSTAATPSAPARAGGRRTRTASRSTSTRSRTPISRAVECIPVRAAHTSIGRISGRAWRCAAGCWCARLPRSGGNGAAAGEARPTTSTSRRPAAEAGGRRARPLIRPAYLSAHRSGDAPMAASAEGATLCPWRESRSSSSAAAPAAR